MTKYTRSWWEINNIVPIVGIILSWIIMFFAWTTRTSILETKMDQVLASQKDMKEMWLQLEKRVGRNEIDLGKIFSIHSEIRQ